MDRKIIFFDIDNTLYNSNVGIPESARRGIKLLRKNGHIPVICTGRTRAAAVSYTHLGGLPDRP